MLEVVTIKNGGEDYLRQVSKEVDIEKEDLTKQVKLMKEWCDINPCFAMASVQFGIPKRIIFLKHSSENVIDPSQNENRVLINPKILDMQGESKYWEKCVSCDQMGLVHRPYKIKMEYYDLDKIRHEDVFEGFIATILCHEYDHLNGVLHIDRAERLIEDMPLEERIVFRKKPENGYIVISKEGQFNYDEKEVSK